MEAKHRTLRGTRRCRGRAGRGISATVLSVTAGILGLPGSPTASAEPVGLTLGYSCAFTGIGRVPLTMRLHTDIPDTIPVGTTSPRSALNGVTTVNEAITRWAALVGAKTVEGSLNGTATVTAPQGDIPLNVPMTIPRTPVPRSGPVDVTARGTAPSLSFTRHGNAQVIVGDLTLSLISKRADGTAPVPTLQASCTLDPGQKRVLQSVTITEPVRPTATATGTGSSGTAGNGNGNGSGTGPGATGGGGGGGGAGGGRGAGGGTGDGTAPSTRPGGGSGGSAPASASPDASATPKTPQPTPTGPGPRTLPPSPGGLPLDPVPDGTGEDGHAAGALDPRSPIVLAAGVLVTGGAAALIAFGPWLRKRRSGDPDDQDPDRG
ncbi:MULTISPECIES: DUF6801 domain-containing protein [Streptomyces]|uniref:DUF6801 domain-containing protein n=1 Tax=Streptomyces TaxID=1883 RepID=UPI0027BAC0F6|nr:DUF6801 domain-containing protein [Streptomyces sp. or20]